MIKSNDTLISLEICEEMWLPESRSVMFAKMGSEIFLNLSSSHHQLRKLKKRYGLIKHFTDTAGGLYIYSNFHGCDGTRLYFDGSASVCFNGEFMA